MLQNDGTKSPAARCSNVLVRKHCLILSLKTGLTDSMKAYLCHPHSSDPKPSSVPRRTSKREIVSLPLSKQENMDVLQVFHHAIQCQSRVLADPTFENVSYQIGGEMRNSKFDDVGKDMVALSYVVLRLGPDWQVIRRRNKPRLVRYVQSLIMKYDMKTERGGKTLPGEMTLGRVMALAGPVTFRLAGAGYARATGDLTILKPNDVFRCLNHNHVAMVWPTGLERFYPYVAAYLMDKAFHPKQDETNRLKWAKTYVDGCVTQNLWPNKPRKLLFVSAGIIGADGRFTEAFQPIADKAFEVWKELLKGGGYDWGSMRHDDLVLTDGDWPRVLLNRDLPLFRNMFENHLSLHIDINAVD